MSVTEYILSKTNRLRVEPEVGNANFSMFNDAGTEVEVSEFLYSLVKMIKPAFILETGTHIGVSSCFMGQALKENNKGYIMTFEIIPHHYTNAQELWKEVEVNSYVQSHLLDAQKFELGNIPIDFLFLDSEPQLRFDEFLKFWPNVKEGGFIAIHDLHPSLGHYDGIQHGVYDWPYGDFRAKIGPYIKDHSVQTISFPTPRGLTLFQKKRSDFSYTQYLLGQI